MVGRASWFYLTFWIFICSHIGTFQLLKQINSFFFFFLSQYVFCHLHFEELRLIIATEFSMFSTNLLYPYFDLWTQTPIWLIYSVNTEMIMNSRASFLNLTREYDSDPEIILCFASWCSFLEINLWIASVHHHILC